MKKVIAIIAAIAILITAGIVFIPRLAHTCDDCGKFFVGTGYKPNVISDLFSDKDQIICKECAEKQHAVSIALGKSVDEFKRKLFE